MTPSPCPWFPVPEDQGLPRLLVVVTVASAAVLAGLASVQGFVLAYAIPPLVMLGWSLWLAPRKLNLDVRRHLDQDRIAYGENIRTVLTVEDHDRELEQVLVEQPLPAGLTLFDGENSGWLDLEPDQPSRLAYRLEGPRGYYVLPPLRVAASDPFGLFNTTETYEPINRLFILPRAIKIPTLAIQARRTRVYPGLIPARKGGPGVEFFGLREYQAGDSWRWLNHRATARSESDLIVNEFQLERAIDIGLILDVRASTNVFTGDRSILEFSIQAAASLADTLLAYGNRVGLFLYGGSIDWTYPGSGKQQYEKILRTLARAKVEASQIFSRLDYVPARLFPHRSLLVLISPLHADDHQELLKLRARGYQVIVVSPDPIAFEEALLEDDEDRALAGRLAALERAHLSGRLLRGGIRVTNWDTRLPFSEVARGIFGYPQPVQALHV